MNKNEIIDFFNKVSVNWDETTIIKEKIFNQILDIADIKEGCIVLDVATGTGVLIPEYLKREVKKCVAVDISEKMTEIAKEKFQKYKNVEILCADAECYAFPQIFDSIVIHNAFPHFINTNQLFENLLTCLKTNGRITVAHSMSRDELIRHHSKSAKKVSSIPPEADELAETMNLYFNIDVKISNEEMYVVSGTKK